MTIERKSRAMVFPKITRFSIAIFALLLIITGIRAFELFGYVFKPIVIKDAVVLIPTGSNFDDVEKIFTEKEVLSNIKAFRWVAKKKSYKENIKAGRYVVKKGWNTNELVNKLRIGAQTPVKVTFNNVRYFDELAGKVSCYFEADSVAFLKAFLNEENYTKYGFSEVTFSSMFIPNTYEFYWTIKPDQFIEKMHVEYKKFWNSNRLAKAEKLELTPVEITTLASIVQEETVKEDEKPKIAGLYLNRLKRGMLLQADPTIKYAIHDFTIRRVTNDMLETTSPYNTYKFAGLPPGPINFPEISSIDAVLNAEDHNYLYMCAKDDFSGYHNFSRTLSQHNINAVKYRRALNQNKIWR